MLRRRTHAQSGSDMHARTEWLRHACTQRVACLFLRQKLPFTPLGDGQHATFAHGKQISTRRRRISKTLDRRRWMQESG
jgi:hypothetical protein